MTQQSNGTPIETALANSISAGSLKSYATQAMIHWGGFALIGYLFFIMVTSELPAMRMADEKRIENLRIADEKRTSALVTGINDLRTELKAVIGANSSAMENLSREVKLSREARMKAENKNGNGSD